MSNNGNSSSMPKGKVWLVGAGPGDAELMTIKALRTIEQADLILFDQLVSEDIKSLFPKSTAAFYVGKSKGKHSIAQADLNKLLVKKANEGLNIVRLKGGDPFVFGRGGEELLTLVKAGVDVEIVPGITAASGCASTTKIPLTHRGLAQGCTFITGHGESSLDANWTALAQLNHTLVFYMGLTNAQMIQNNLLAAGMDPSTPLAIIENGCRANQREIIGNLNELYQLVEEHSVASPSLIIIGDVVSVADQINDWLATQNIEQAMLATAKCA